MFPENANPPAIDPYLIQPLPYHDYVELVLVPEVSTFLIAADLHVDLDEVVETWEQSSQYGRQVFVASDDDVTQAVTSKGKGKEKLIREEKERDMHVKPETTVPPFRLLIENGEEILVVEWMRLSLGFRWMQE